MAGQNSIIWFRQDLRINDNPALLEAIKNSDKVCAVYILDEQTKGIRKIGDAQKWWLHHSLSELNENLKKLNIELSLFEGRSADILKDIFSDKKFSALYFNFLIEPGNKKLDDEICDLLEKKDIKIKKFNGSYLIEPWVIKNGQGEFFKVFTPFYRKALEHHTPRKPNNKLSKAKATDKLSNVKLADWNLLPTKPDWSKGFTEYFTPGEEGAKTRLKKFLQDIVKTYSEDRDIPSVDGTSKLSPHLHFGEISPHVVFYAAQFEKREHPTKTKGIDKFVSELYWREFSYNLLHHFPKLPDENFREDFNRFPWHDDAAQLKAWQKGQTGYPIVDAGIRELWHTGWMHNRVRMIVGSFLVKHLTMHWKNGEEWFWDTLLDADLANNSASWQWVAGSGADAAPYFRIFNPIIQGKKFDAKGEYVKKWVPELEGLPDKYIHNPWEAPTEVLDKAKVVLGKTYPAPLVDHNKGRANALKAFEKVRK